MNNILTPNAWGLTVNEKGELDISGFSTVDLAQAFGTPLHVVHEERLKETANQFVKSMKSEYPGKISVHYPFKCNSVPAIVQAIREVGLKAEVMTEFELQLAEQLGFRGEEIIVNGPCKTRRLLHRCIESGVRFIIVDSIDELIDLLHLSEVLGKESEILLRVNPNYTPRGLNRGSATGSRVGSAFGLDFMGGEVTAALDMLTKSSKIRFAGFHFHIGTGIRNPKDHANALRCIADLFRIARMRGLMVRVLNVGGGFASMTSRELTNSEMLLYQAFGIFPSSLKNGEHVSFADFAREISSELLRHFPFQEIPELMFEPGRCITSANQFLLLTVERVKKRAGVPKWVIVDGGLSTVTLPTYYEYHEVLLCDNLYRPYSEKVNIIGPACFSGDIVYRNKWMPRVEPGEVIAIMDTGAYFTALESSFGFARPAIIAVGESECRIVRSRESFEESIARDHFQENVHQEENIP